MEQYKFFASAPRGLEIPLSLELSRMGAHNVKMTEGGVHFSGDLETCYKANLYSHTAEYTWRWHQKPTGQSRISTIQHFL